MSLRRTVRLALLGIALSTAAHARGGTTAAGFLTQSGSARGAAMGDAYGAVVDDASAIFWNPASLALIQSRSAGLLHGTDIEESRFNTASYGQRAGGGAWGLGLQYFSAGDIPRLDDAGEPAGAITPNDLALSVGYGGRLGLFRWGGTIKYIRSKFVQSASTAAGDLGLLSPPLFHNHVRLAATAVNIGGRLTYDQVGSDLPRTFRLASATTWKSMTIGLDWIRPDQSDAVVALGVEQRWYTGSALSLSIRGGYNSRRVGGETAGYSTGVGFGFRQLSVDYAYVTRGTFDAGHRVSLNYGF
jgi:hypothetical protein